MRGPLEMEEAKFLGHINCFDARNEVISAIIFILQVDKRINLIKSPIGNLIL